MGERHYVLGQVAHWTGELRQWAVEQQDVSGRPLADAALTWEAREWRKFFERALSAGWIERTGAID